MMRYGTWSTTYGRLGSRWRFSCRGWWASPPNVLSFGLNGTHSEQLPKLSDCKASVLHDIAHREGIDRVMSWYGNGPEAVGRYNMPSLANNPESRLSSALTLGGPLFTHSFNVLIQERGRMNVMPLVPGQARNYRRRDSAYGAFTTCHRPEAFQ